MKLNKIIFPSPTPTYDQKSLLGDLIFIPRNALIADDQPPKKKSFFSSLSSSTDNDTTTFAQKSTRKSDHIPCLYLPYQNGSSKILLYFHGNAEDVGISYEMLDHFRNSLKINVLAMEYPGYGVY